MKLPISRRLLCCAEMLEPGSVIADIGTDHGYLPIHLALGGAPLVYAAELREKPLEKAKENARRFGVSEQIVFRQSDGLQSFDGTEMDTVVCAGMGADLIVRILEGAPYLRSERHRLVLQPQSSGQDLRQWLDENGFYITREALVQEGGFLYSVLCARFGRQMHLTPGGQFVSPALLQSGNALLPLQLARLERSLQKTIAGIVKGGAEADAEKLLRFQAALAEITEMRRKNDNGQ
jgi:tRNA (adenine22-N1)-methyltransferase